MASANTNQSSLIVEPLTFHQVHGSQIQLSEGNALATRDRLNSTLVFTNRPVLPNEIVQFLIEDVSTEFYGLIRLGLTTLDPASLTAQTLPKSMPATDHKDWFVPPPRGSPTLQKDKTIQLKYTAEGDISLDYDGKGFYKSLTVSPISRDVWCALDMNGMVSRIRLVQNASRVLATAVQRSRTRFLQYTNNRQNENHSVYYSGELTADAVTMRNCDENCELADQIAVKKNSSASITIDRCLKRSMRIVMQVLDMDHTLASYFTVRCLTNGRPSDEHSKLIDTSHDHINLSDEIGLSIMPDGLVTFSVNNRIVKPLFKIDLTANDNANVRETTYCLDFLLNGRVTGMRLIGVYLPTAEEMKAPPMVGGGCSATIIHRVCPNGLTGLLLPCRHLCVCYECGLALTNSKSSCPIDRCRKPVAGCIKVFRD